MKANDREAADRILAHVYGHVDAFRARPPRPREQFAAAGLMRCCALLKGILVLDEAGMPALASILARQHWEAWLVSLYVLLAGDEALQVIAGDDIYWKRRLAKALRLERDDYQPDWAGRLAKLNYKELHDRMLVLLREREAVDGPAGVTGFDVTSQRGARQRPAVVHFFFVIDESITRSFGSEHRRLNLTIYEQHGPTQVSIYGFPAASREMKR